MKIFEIIPLPYSFYKPHTYFRRYGFKFFILSLTWVDLWESKFKNRYGIELCLHLKKKTYVLDTFKK